MKNLFLGLVILAPAFSPISSFAHPGTELHCKSESFDVNMVWGDRVQAYGNYSVNGKENKGADVEVERAFASDRVVSASLTVDGRRGVFEVAATRGKFGKRGNYRGYINVVFGDLAERARCTVKQVVVREDRVIPIQDPNQEDNRI